MVTKLSSLQSKYGEDISYKMNCACVRVCSVVSNSLWPNGL